MKSCVLLTSMFFVVYADLCNIHWVPVGKPTYFTCVISQEKFASVSWYKNVERLVFCDAPNKCNAKLTLYNATLTTMNSSLISVFSINEVKTFEHNTNWTCSTTVTEGLGKTSCHNLFVYAPVEFPTCDKELLLSNNLIITIRCWADHVFLDAKCIFFMKTNENDVSTKLSNQTVTYKTTPLNTSEYYKTECNNTVSVEFIGHGSHQFYVVMHPNIPIDITEDMKSKSQTTRTIIIGDPKATLTPDCDFNQYIKENETRTCTCYDSNRHFLPTQVRWNDIVGGNGILSFIAKRPSFQFNCTVSNGLNWTNTVTYEGRVAYTPVVTNLTLIDQEFSVCENQSYNISGICSVSDSYPKPTVTITIDFKSSLNISQPSSKTTDYFFITNSRLTGMLNISCEANNDIYPVSSVYQVATVYGPPSSPKIGKRVGNDMLFEQTNFMEVETGDNIIICQSSGGYPYSKNLTLKCGDEKVNKSDVDIVSMILRVPEEKKNKTLSCSCVVSHLTKCFTGSSIEVDIIVNSVTHHSDTIYMVVGLALGIIILTVLSLLFLYKIHTECLKNSKDEYEKLVNNCEVYFIEEKPLFVANCQEYTNVTITMKSAAEIPKNFFMEGLRNKN